MHANARVRMAYVTPPRCRPELHRSIHAYNAFNSIFANVCAMSRRYMKDFAPKPTILPVSVSVSIPHKGIVLQHIVLAPTDTPRNLRDIVRDRLAAMSNPLIAWAPSNVFVWKKDASMNMHMHPTCTQRQSLLMQARTHSPHKYTYRRSSL